MILLFVFCLSILAHELGHLLVAKALGIRVRKFCVFFDPGFSLLSTGRRFKTTYSMGWIPLGGYVRFALPLNKEERPSWCIHAQKPWKKMMVGMAGVMVNILVAYSCLALYIEPQVKMKTVADVVVHVKNTNKAAQRLTVRMLENLYHSFVPDKGGVTKTDEYQYRTLPAQMCTIKVEHDFWNVIWLMIVINLSLAIINILPLPALDGGQVMFALYEMVFRKPVNEMVQILLVLSGIMLILGIFLYDVILDVVHCCS